MAKRGRPSKKDLFARKEREIAAALVLIGIWRLFNWNFFLFTI